MRIGAVSRLPRRSASTQKVLSAGSVGSALEPDTRIVNPQSVIVNPQSEGRQGCLRYGVAL